MVGEVNQEAGRDQDYPSEVLEQEAASETQEESRTLEMSVGSGGKGYTLKRLAPPS